jgi:hypothetical protein
MFTDAGWNIGPVPPTRTSTVAALRFANDGSRRHNVARVKRWRCNEEQAIRISAEGVLTVGTLRDFPGKNAIGIELLFGCTVIFLLILCF